MKEAERGQRFLTILDRWLGIPLTLPAAIFRSLARNRKPQEPLKIGIICLGAIGDLLLLSALTSGIKKSEPNSWLEIIASNANAQALPLNPDADAFFYAPIKHPFIFIRHIRKQSYDILIDSSQWARLGNLYCNLSGAGLTAGFDTAGQMRAAGYDKICKHRSDRHEVENFLALGRSIWPDLEGKPSLKDIKAPEIAQTKTIYCHLWPAPGRGRIFKQWPENNWSDLISAMLTAGYHVRLTGSRRDVADCQAFRERFFKDNASVKSIAGQLNLTALARCFANASAVVSVNTGIMHLAALSGVATIGLHGATNPIRWGPYGKRCISLVPSRGEYGYLNLGFEYGANRKPAMQWLSVASALDGLRQLGLDI